MKPIVGVLTKNKLAQGLVLLLIAVLAADLGFYVMRTAPAASKAASYESQISEAKKRIADKEAQARVYGDYRGGVKQVEDFKGRLPRRDQYVEVLDGLYKLAVKDGMRAESFGTATNETKEGELAEVRFIMPVTGSYEGVRRFIHDIEGSPMFLNINRLSLSTGKAGEVGLKIELSTYVRS